MKINERAIIGTLLLLIKMHFRLLMLDQLFFIMRQTIGRKVLLISDVGLVITISSVIIFRAT